MVSRKGQYSIMLLFLIIIIDSLKQTFFIKFWKQTVCLFCFLSIDSLAEGCAVEMKNLVSNHTYFFNMSLNSSKQAMESSSLNCYTIPETGEYTVCVYEIQYGGVLGHNCWMLSNVTVEKETANTPVSSQTDERSNGE